ncbi:ATP-dependent DNA helicase [Trichonephila clavata]|uniref:ATP-dependent DNA helicase n=1 Tax=Trichonephila clavata TaxID=2740835 RepID=A0A8X6FVY1_TRICU|nr:ATP-dependent DNA helicase [Trichonephila clavata]
MERLLNRYNASTSRIYNKIFSLPFAGIPILALGDFNQLRPVGGSYPFAPRSDPLARLAGELNPLWDGFQLFELNQIMRQKDDLRFAEALNRLAIGRLTSAYKELFNTRCFTETTLPPEAQSSLRLMATNAQVDHYNNLRINTVKQQNPVNIKLITEDKLIGTVTERQRANALDIAQKLKREDIKSLMLELELVVGIKYMVSCNVDVEDGLFNGAAGTLRFIEFNMNRRPEAVYIEFVNPKVGAIARQSRKSIMDQLVNDGKIQGNWTPIMRNRQTFNVHTKGSTQIC